MYEDMKSLFANSVLFLLAIALTDNFFQNYQTFEDIEPISSSADESLYHHEIKKDVLRV
jgi:hypothetical protein